jgi:hypothetical protein
MSGGQIESLRADPSACSCDFPRAAVERAKPAAPPREISALSHPREPGPIRGDFPPPPLPSTQEPVYTVLMPPLSFDANSPALAPDPDPETILLVREVRLRSSSIYRGHVDPPAAQASIAPPATPPAPPRAGGAPPAAPPHCLMDRVRNFFRKLTG